MKKDDDFGTVLNRYMSEQKITVAALSVRTGISQNVIIGYRSGDHIPNDIHKLVALCIGLQINEYRAEYLMNLAHMSFGYDSQGVIYKMLISLAFFVGLSVSQVNEILSNYGLQEL